MAGGGRWSPRIYRPFSTARRPPSAARPFTGPNLALLRTVRGMSEESVRFPYRNELRMPVIGLEAEFKSFVDEREVEPETYWRTPAAFIDRPLLHRSSKASQLPTGGAVYFDGGVVEVVTPVIEIAPQCTARVVRSLWEQIAFVRDQLDRWETRNARRVRLEA